MGYFSVRRRRGDGFEGVFYDGDRTSRRGPWEGHCALIALNCVENPWLRLIASVLQHASAAVSWLTRKRAHAALIGRSAVV